MARSRRASSSARPGSWSTLERRTPIADGVVVAADRGCHVLEGEVVGGAAAVAAVAGVVAEGGVHDRIAGGGAPGEIGRGDGRARGQEALVEAVVAGQHRRGVGVDPPAELGRRRQRQARRVRHRHLAEADDAVVGQDRLELAHLPGESDRRPQRAVVREHAHERRARQPLRDDDLQPRRAGPARGAARPARARPPPSRAAIRRRAGSRGTRRSPSAAAPRACRTAWRRTRSAARRRPRRTRPAVPRSSRLTMASSRNGACAMSRRRVRQAPQLSSQRLSYVARSHPQRSTSSTLGRGVIGMRGARGSVEIGTSVRLFHCSSQA